MTDSKPILYSYWRSSCSWRVRLVLTLKGIPYDIVPIDLHNGKHEQFSEKYREVNPMCQVPSLMIDGHKLVESLAIIYYLEETRPQPSLLPKDAYKRAKVHEICQIVTSGIQPYQNDTILDRIGEKSDECAKFYINRGFQAIEQLLETSAGKYCVGNEITIADCCLVPQVFNARRFGMDLTAYPTIVRIDRELSAFSAFQSTHPNNQPDCPSED